MTVFETRMASTVRSDVDTSRTPSSGSEIGWMTAVAWPAVWIGVVAGALLGTAGTLLFWAGVVGVLAMFARQVFRVAGRGVRRANSVVDGALVELDLDGARISGIGSGRTSRSDRAAVSTTDATGASTDRPTVSASHR